jgi:twitching motility protein PilJ
MAFLDYIKNIFGITRYGDSVDSRLSLSAPESSLMSVHDSLRSIPAVDTSAGKRPLPPTPSTPSVTPKNLNNHPGDQIRMPFLGVKTVAQHQFILSIVLGLSLLSLAIVTISGLNRTDTITGQLGAISQALMHSQRLAKSVSQAVVGDLQAFIEVSQSVQVLATSVRALASGDPELKLKALADPYRTQLEKSVAMVTLAEKNAATIMSQQKILTQMGASLRLMGQQSSSLLESAQRVATLKLQHNASSAEMAATGQLLMLTQRIGKLSNEILTSPDASPESVVLLGKDIDTFGIVTKGLLYGHDLQLNASALPQVRDQLGQLIRLFEETRQQANNILGNVNSLVAAREAQASIVADSEKLRVELEALQNALSSHTGVGAGLLLALSVALSVLCAAGLSYAQLQESRKRHINAEAQRQQALRQEKEAKRINDANQAAILRLMNELQTVAEGDLTQEATVTEDITGAIADSVNYTVEELRALVGNVQKTASRVAQTTGDVDATSTELLAASREQLHEIRETGRSIVDMAARMTQVSVQAQASADVAKQSLQAAEVGLQAVQNSIGGMNAIRDQIQDTAKRIKRLGESSQEIGEITELISDITEQTNVLALNAAIQAASAGDAGRGFSVVAEEVQRLAERSADATRQIAALVKTIQTDTQDAIGAMERSTQGVVAGAKLSDNAGTALTEIDQVSRRLADLIGQISDSSSREANFANAMAGDIQHIFAVTEQTGEGTRSTAAQVRELSKMAEELRQSVARFRIV